MVGIVNSIGSIEAAQVAELVRSHLVLLSHVDALAAEAVAKPETLNIGMQLKLVAGEARGMMRRTTAQ